jgi:hypothetical protein
VNVDAVRRDWSNRQKWMQTYLNEEDSKTLVLEILLEYDVLMQEASHLYEKEENPKAKVQLVYALLKILDRKTEILKQLGAFEKIKYDYESKAREHPQRLNFNPKPKPSYPLTLILLLSPSFF